MVAGYDTVSGLSKDVPVCRKVYIIVKPEILFITDLIKKECEYL